MSRTLIGAALLGCLLVGGCRSLGPSQGSRPPQGAKVVLIPLGRIPDKDLRTAEEGIRKWMPGAQVRIAPKLALPRSCYYPPRARYRADRLLDILDKQPALDEKAIALTAVDISTTSRGHADWGVLGLGRLAGSSCMVSTHRLGRSKVGERLYRLRLAKVVVHELGHTLGLPHCKTPRCLMNDAEASIATVDKEEAFCPTCRRTVTA